MNGDQTTSNGATPQTGPPAGLDHCATVGLAAVMWRRRWTVCCCLGLVLGLALWYLSWTKPSYTSTATIYVAPTGPRIIHETQPGVMTASNNYLYTQAELIKSTPVISGAVEICRPEGLQAFAGVTDPVEWLKGLIEVSVGRKDDIIRVCLTSPYRYDNAKIVNAIVQSYLDFHAARKRGTSAQILEILQRQKAACDKALTGHLEALTRLRQEHPTLAFQRELGGTAFAAFERLSEALTEARLAASEARSYYQAAEQMADDPCGLLALVQSRGGQAATVLQQLQDLRASLQQLQANRQDRLRLLTTGHPAVAALDAQISQVKQQIHQLEQQSVQTYLAVLRQQYLAAKQRQELLDNSLQEQYRQVAELNKVMVQYAFLQSQYDQAKRQSDLLEQRIREVDVAEDAGALNITVLEEGRPAATPSRPQRAKIIAMAAMVGLATGWAAALVREAADRRLRQTDQIVRLAGCPIIGLVPSIRRRRITAGLRPWKLDRPAPVLEAFRGIRTAILFGMPHGQSRTIQVTSALPREGKSTVASNLAVAIACCGRSVLLLDANQARPDQHAIFGLTASKDLGSVLAGSARLSEAIVPTKVPGLHLVWAGPAAVGPCETVSSRHFAAILAKLSQYYDRIIVDGPAVLAGADAQIIASQCQVTILVVRPSICREHALELAVRSLASTDGRPAGAVINAVPRRWHGKGYQLGRLVSAWNGNGRKRIKNIPFGTDQPVREPACEVAGHATSRT